MTPQVIDNFLPDADYDRLRKFIQSKPMRYGAKSNGATDPHGHWSWKPVHDNQQNLADLTMQLGSELREDCWRNIQAKYHMESAAVIRCYANGYTYGTDGYFHTDSKRADETTIIIYICDKWEPDWAGETCWYSSMAALSSALPAPNRAVLLPSAFLHCARAVSRKCPELRTTFMYKTRPWRSEAFEKLSSFLVNIGALNHKHSLGTLHDHLVRTYAILEHKKFAPEVCLGAGLHSIYGTNAFPHKLLDGNSAVSRNLVAETFGRAAEALAFLFSVIDRPRTLEAPRINKVGTYVLDMRHDNIIYTTPAAVLRNLQLIECANLLDQDALGKWPNLNKLWEATCGQLQS